MRKTASLIVGIVFSVSAYAQSLPVVNGTVTKIDTGQGKMTIRHDPIPNLDMGDMTMVFRAGSPDMLKQVKIGDTIRFTADRINGQITVVSIVKG